MWLWRSLSWSIMNPEISPFHLLPVRRVSQRFGFREVGDDEECTLYWTDLSVTIERVVSMKKWQVRVRSVMKLVSVVQRNKPVARCRLI